MGKASNFNIGRIKIVWIFCRCGNEKMLKIDFFHKTLIPRNLLKEKNIRARSMWNPTSWRFRKCGTYWACEVLNGSYRPSKMDESEKTGPSSKIRGVTKKDTATILSFELCHGSSVEPTILGPRWFRMRAQISILWPCLFFWRLLSIEFFLQFSPNFDSQ